MFYLLVAKYKLERKWCTICDQNVTKTAEPPSNVRQLTQWKIVLVQVTGVSDIQNGHNLNYLLIVFHRYRHTHTDTRLMIHTDTDIDTVQSFILIPILVSLSVWDRYRCRYQVYLHVICLVLVPYRYWTWSYRYRYQTKIHTDTDIDTAIPIPIPGISGTLFCLTYKNTMHCNYHAAVQCNIHKEALIVYFI